MREQCLYSRTSFECLAPMTVTTPSHSLSFGLITSLGSQEPSVPFWEALLLCFDEGLGVPKAETLLLSSEEMQTRKPHRCCFSLPSYQRFPPRELFFALPFGGFYVCWIYGRTDSFPTPTPLDKSYFSFAWAIARVSQQLSLLLGHPTCSLKFIFLNSPPWLKNVQPLLASNRIKIFSLGFKSNHSPLAIPKSTGFLASSPNMSPSPLIQFPTFVSLLNLSPLPGTPCHLD